MPNCSLSPSLKEEICKLKPELKGNQSQNKIKYKGQRAKVTTNFKIFVANFAAHDTSSHVYVKAAMQKHYTGAFQAENWRIKER